MQHNVVVLYHQRMVAPERCGEFHGLWSVNLKRIQLVNQRQLQPEHTAAPGYGRQRQAVPQRVGQTLHDGQAQAQAFAPVALGVAQLMEFTEYVLLVFRRNTNAGVADFHHHLVTALPATHQHAATVCVTNGVGHQVSQYQIHQRRV